MSAKSRHRRPPEVDIASAIAMRAFERGFAVGADLLSGMRRTAVDPETHEHWRRGFDAGRCAIKHAERMYGSSLADSVKKAR